MNNHKSSGLLSLNNVVSYLEDDFFVSECNKNAYQYIKSWPNWGDQRFSNILYLYGPESSGKTHLAHIWKTASKAIILEDNFNTELLYNNNNYILENIENISDENHILHLINIAVEHKEGLLITSRFNPASLKIALPDLKSRINAINSSEIMNPDNNSLELILYKQFSDRQIRINSDITKYILTRIERSYKSISNFVEKVDIKSLQEKRDITIPFIKKLLT